MERPPHQSPPPICCRPPLSPLSSAACHPPPPQQDGRVPEGRRCPKMTTEEWDCKGREGTRYTRFLPHPSNGGLRGYDIPFRQMMGEAYLAGNPTPNGMLRSIQCWTNCTIPFQMTKNKSISALLTGQYLLLLMAFKFIWPQATYIKCIAFIAKKSNDARIFSEKDVSKALRKLGYTMKVASTVAYQAFTERNLNHCCLYWTWPWPLGIHGTPRRLLIDGDEFRLHLNSANRKYGSSPRGMKIRKPGNYDRGAFKLIIILAVETGDPAILAGVIGSVSNPCIWARVTTEPGTFMLFVICRTIRRTGRSSM
jgi:hypothetical protein